MSNAPVRVAIAVGSNIEDRAAYLRSALTAVAAIEGIQVLAVSSLSETEAIGGVQANYLNAMVLVSCELPMRDLLVTLQHIETQNGRERLVPKGPRTLDLDIVWAEKIVITSAELLVPHPALRDREFWQQELAELLGIEGAAMVIDSALVHAGLDTATYAWNPA